MCIVVGEHRVSLITPVGAAGYDGYPPERAGGRLFAQKEEVWVCALLRAGHRTIYIRCTYGNFGREITKYNAYIKITPRNYTTIKIKIKNHTKKSPNTHTHGVCTHGSGHPSYTVWDTSLTVDYITDALCSLPSMSLCVGADTLPAEIDYVFSSCNF